MKKIRMMAAAFLILMCFALTGCGKYISSWSASAYVHSNTSKLAYMDFGTFSGTQVHTLKVKEESGTLKYTAKLETGSATVYVDYDGEKKELFSIKDGESKEGSLKDLKEGKIYVIVETDGKCENGEFEFELE